ncbi:hypothetical protein PVAND_001863 [Polypedilum vanderplanki]|uniref:Protein PTHB1 n=1 Tax=Polypedilum vanderplanki TaxID=319348 RepID=A0A9J6BQH0_POLVA|nr:hypothetical protein PVAND_001863 [Polypedilum vanderplanki]
MSLFKIIEYFKYQCPDDNENYDSFSLTCARLNAENEEQKDSVIITSHSGFISILQPSISDDRDLNSQQMAAVAIEYHHPNVVYETKLNQPILSVLSGNFVQYSTQKQDRQNVIAILHPNKLVIYSLVTSEGFAEHGQQSKLQILHQHELTKSAFTMCKGNFGGVKGKEFICVMFLDGSLRFFEQDGITQTCILPGSRTIPSPFVYIPRIDCFMILAPNWDLECYRYLSLSEAYERRLTPIWSINVGEYILDMNTHQVSNTESVIVLLGENNLICISDTGKIKFIKKLDYTPLALCSFTVGWFFEPECKLMIAVATDNGSLLIYQNTTLVWCAELVDETIALKRGNFTGISGAIVTLNSTGKLSIGYLGSEPHIFKVPPLNLSKLDYEKSKIELEEMEKEINSSVDNSDIPYINETAEREVEIKSRLEFDNLNKNAFMRLSVKFTPHINLEQIQLYISPNPAFRMSTSTFFYNDLQAHERHSFETEIYLSETEVGEIFSTVLTIVVTFINKQSIARVLQHSVEVPLQNIATVTQPQKDDIFKVTLSAMPVVDIAALFSDITLADVGQALGIKTLNYENTVTIILAKNSNRYRLQSNSLVTLAFMLNIIIERLSQISTTTDQKNNSKSITVKSIPASTIEYLLSCIEKHHSMKNEMRTIADLLASKTIEMRLFERCFLVKMQGKASAQTMDGIEMLLKDTYNEILKLSSQYKAVKANLNKVQTQLSQTIYFIRKVIEYADLPQKITENLLCIMRPGLMDFSEQTCIEALAPYVDYLYNIYQAKGNQNQFYDNFSFRNDNFSLTRFSKQLKHVLSILVDSSSDDKKTMENAFIIEENETTMASIGESEWSSKSTNTLLKINEQLGEN